MQEISSKKISDTSSKKKENTDFQYKNKIRSAVYVFILFIILSNKVSYKILDLIIKVFTNNVEIIDENENPMFLGVLIMSFLMSLIIFMF